MFAMFWPFDLSISGILVCGVAMWLWIISAAASATKKAVESETGKGIIAAWLESVFKK